MEYENAQKRVLEVFGQWKAPVNFKIEFFVVRVGDWGGHILVDCDDPLTVHKSSPSGHVQKPHCLVGIDKFFRSCSNSLASSVPS
jgi:hypothetical protein